MKKEVKQVLKTWRTSLERYEKLDGWKLDQSLSILGDYLRSKEDPNSIRGIVRKVRDKAISPSFDKDEMLVLLNRLFNRLDPQVLPQVCMMTKRGAKRIQKKGQDVRFRSQTSHIFEEKLRFKEGMLLRNFDIETESASDSRKVRRIIEKRMCQAYHRLNKMSQTNEKGRPSNSDRYWEHRATSFQLYNIGQVENVAGVSRGDSTHWKRMLDLQTGKVVFKKKMAYPSEEAALEAIERWKIEHPYDKRELHAYQCAVCHKWHIGHESSRVLEPETENFDVAC